MLWAYLLVLLVSIFMNKLFKVISFLVQFFFRYRPPPNTAMFSPLSVWFGSQLKNNNNYEWCKFLSSSILIITSKPAWLSMKVFAILRFPLLYTCMYYIYKLFSWFTLSIRLNLLNTKDLSKQTAEATSFYAM